MVTGLGTKKVVGKSEELVIDSSAKKNNEINRYMEERRSELNKISYGSGLLGGAIQFAGKFVPFWVKGTTAVATATIIYKQQQYLNQLGTVSSNINNGTSYQLQKDAIYQSSYEQKWEKGKIVDVENKVLIGYDYKITFDSDGNRDGKPDTYHLAKKDYETFESMSTKKTENDKK